MRGRAGFWSQRRRGGQEDAGLLLAARLHELRHTPYAQLVERAARPTEVEEVQGTSGEAYERRTSVARHTRGGGEELRITVQVARGSLLGRLNPLAEEVVLATPDGEMFGEYTMASEGTTPRRYDWPGRDRS